MRIRNYCFSLEFVAYALNDDICKAIWIYTKGDQQMQVYIEDDAEREKEFTNLSLTLHRFELDKCIG